VLELIQFPPDKGKPKWQEAGGRLFLGIDHTAIVVADTDASLRLYRDVLGLEVAGASENWGTEQEHLYNVFGARLRITSLWAPAGPGIELLEYLSPRDGRPAPADSRACDLWHWETRLRARDGAAALGALDRARAAVVSPGLIRTAGAGLGFGRGLLVRDADGHALQIVE
jgi:catechol 2,3-dioxygenase-like lactoylglutathione lyase family enzyme